MSKAIDLAGVENAAREQQLLTEVAKGVGLAMDALKGGKTDTGDILVMTELLRATLKSYGVSFTTGGPKRRLGGVIWDWKLYIDSDGDLVGEGNLAWGAKLAPIACKGLKVFDGNFAQLPTTDAGWIAFGGAGEVGEGVGDKLRSFGYHAAGIVTPDGVMLTTTPMKQEATAQAA